MHKTKAVEKAPLESVWKPKFQPPQKMKAPEFTEAS